MTNPENATTRRWHHWLRPATLEDAVLRAAESPRVFWWLTLITAVENTVIPLTLEPVVVPIMAVERHRAWVLAAALWLGSVLGGLFMYGVGAGIVTLFEPTAGTTTEQLDAFATRLDVQGFWAIFIFAITPLPYQVATVGAGLSQYPLLWFLAAIGFARGILYASFALLAITIGRAFADAVERHKRTIVGVGLVIGLLTLALPLVLG